MEGLFYSKINNDKVICTLCPHNCKISDGKYGVCKVRKNVNGILISENYGLISSLGFDPIEKKPLYHFYPGKEILSIGSIGCNLQCQFCQNYSISQTAVADFRKNYTTYTPEQIRDIALSHSANIGIAFTYNEPTIFFEFMLDTAKISKSAGLKNVMVTNGFINPEPLELLNNYIDAYNVDLKSFNDIFYKNHTKSNLEPVKETLINIMKAGKHLEITNLIIPTLNDSEVEFETMCQWIASNLGKEVVLHISRYFPIYKMAIEQTSIEQMILLYSIAKKYLNFVYLGNVLLDEGNNTYCNSCKELLISRKGYFTKIVSVDKSGNCSKCGNKVLNNS
jgi:pyruvate formate lyase activating enzyme